MKLQTRRQEYHPPGLRLLCGMRHPAPLVAATVAMTLLFGTAAEAHVPTLGASGAIAAVLGAYFVLYPNSTVRGLRKSHSRSCRAAYCCRTNPIPSRTAAMRVVA